MSRSRSVLVGTCGFSEARARSFRNFGILEVQQTFYQPPRIGTAARWRTEAARDFVFTLKCWQLVTHEASSPTYRRLRERLSEDDLARAGGFRWNPLTRRAWERTREIADALGAEAIVFQTPRSFAPTPANLRRLERFLRGVERDGRRLVFEPRGEAWSDELLRGLVRDLGVVVAVDPFLRPPIGRGLRYLRLHGRPAYRYHYRYSDADLRALEAVLSRTGPTWVLFNNDAMAADARRFLKRLGRR